MKKKIKQPNLINCILIINVGMRQYKLSILFLVTGLVMLGTACTNKDIDLDLSSRDWKVEKIRKSGKLIYTGTDSTYILTFTSGETYGLNLDVNSCSGHYEIPQKGSIGFQPMACTKVCCDTDFALDLATLFPEMNGYFVRDNRLHFEGNGEIILLPN
jgi:hypothetical protein